MIAIELWYSDVKKRVFEIAPGQIEEKIKILRMTARWDGIKEGKYQIYIVYKSKPTGNITGDWARRWYRKYKTK